MKVLGASQIHQDVEDQHAREQQMAEERGPEKKGTSFNRCCLQAKE